MGDGEFYRLVFLQAFVACGSDGAVMHEDIFSPELGVMNPKPFFTIEPFDGSYYTVLT